MLDLVLPLECGGCGAPSTRWCQVCAAELAVRPDAPHLASPRVDPQVPVFTLGRYAGARRRAVLAVKEQGRTDLITPLAQAMAVGLHRLLTWGMVGTPLTIVPAPTRRSAARRRGGDPVARIAATAAAGCPGVVVAPVLRMRALVRDSVGLNSGARERNIAGRVLVRRGGLRRLPPGGEILFVDDIVTTGATMAESVRVLASGGVQVAAALVIAAA
ncbi:MAG TPA: ComF family protein [Mycobacterium sp.]